MMDKNGIMQEVCEGDVQEWHNAGVTFWTRFLTI